MLSYAEGSSALARGISADASLVVSSVNGVDVHHLVVVGLGEEVPGYSDVGLDHHDLRLAHI